MYPSSALSYQLTAPSHPRCCVPRQISSAPCSTNTTNPTHAEHSFCRNSWDYQATYAATCTRKFVSSHEANKVKALHNTHSCAHTHATNTAQGQALQAPACICIYAVSSCEVLIASDATHDTHTHIHTHTYTHTHTHTHTHLAKPSALRHARASMLFLAVRCFQLQMRHAHTRTHTHRHTQHTWPSHPHCCTPEHPCCS